MLNKLKIKVIQCKGGLCNLVMGKHKKNNINAKSWLTSVKTYQERWYSMSKRISDQVMWQWGWRGRWCGRICWRGCWHRCCLAWWRGWWPIYLCWRGRLCGANVVGLIIFGGLCFCLPYLLWSAVGDGARSGASWFYLEPAVRGKRRRCLWCRCWTGPVDSVSLLKVRALWMVVLRLVLLLGCGWWRWWLANLEPKTKSCCGGGAAGCWRQWIGVDLWPLSVIVGCDRRWCRMVDRSVELMCRSSWWRVCRCDCLRRRWWRGVAAEDRRWTVFFFCL